MCLLLFLHFGLWDLHSEAVSKNARTLGTFQVGSRSYTVYQRTWQAQRGFRFSVWGLGRRSFGWMLVVKVSG